MQWKLYSVLKVEIIIIIIIIAVQELCYTVVIQQVK